MDMEERPLKVEKFKRGLKLQSQAAVKTSFILAEEIAKSARPFTEGNFIKSCMLDEVCPEKGNYKEILGQ